MRFLFFLIVVFCKTEGSGIFSGVATNHVSTGMGETPWTYPEGSTYNTCVNVYGNNDVDYNHLSMSYSQNITILLPAMPEGGVVEESQQMKFYEFVSFGSLGNVQRGIFSEPHINITGVEVKMWVRSTDCAVEKRVFWEFGDPLTSNYGNTINKVMSGTWPSSRYSMRTYGSSSDLWGVSSEQWRLSFSKSEEPMPAFLVDVQYDTKYECSVEIACFSFNVYIQLDEEPGMETFSTSTTNTPVTISTSSPTVGSMESVTTQMTFWENSGSTSDNSVRKTTTQFQDHSGKYTNQIVTTEPDLVQTVPILTNYTHDGSVWIQQRKTDSIIIISIVLSVVYCGVSCLAIVFIRKKRILQKGKGKRRKSSSSNPGAIDRLRSLLSSGNYFNHQSQEQSIPMIPTDQKNSDRDTADISMEIDDDVTHDHDCNKDKEERNSVDSTECELSSSSSEAELGRSSRQFQITRRVGTYDIENPYEDDSQEECYKTDLEINLEDAKQKKQVPVYDNVEDIRRVIGQSDYVAIPDVNIRK